MHKVLVALSTLSLLPVTSNAVEKSIKLPEKIILNTARKLKPQTAPYYFVRGVLTCSQVMKKYYPPFHEDPYTFEVSSCEMIVNQKNEMLDKPDEVIETLKTLKPRPDHDDWTISVYFSAESLSREFPPYTVTESAVVESY